MVRVKFEKLGTELQEKWVPETEDGEEGRNAARLQVSELKDTMSCLFTLVELFFSESTRSTSSSSRWKVIDAQVTKELTLPRLSIYDCLKLTIDARLTDGGRDPADPADKYEIR